MPADTKPIDLAGLRVLLEKMTPRPWEVTSNASSASIWQVTGDDEPEVHIAAMSVIENGRPYHDPDAAGIVAIVNVAGALLDRIAELEAGLREACDVAAQAMATSEAVSLIPADDESIARLRSLLENSK